MHAPSQMQMQAAMQEVTACTASTAAGVVLWAGSSSSGIGGRWAHVQCRRVADVLMPIGHY